MEGRVNDEEKRAAVQRCMDAANEYAPGDPIAQVWVYGLLLGCHVQHGQPIEDAIAWLTSQQLGIL